VVFKALFCFSFYAKYLCKAKDKSKPHIAYEFLMHKENILNFQNLKSLLIR